MISKLSIFVTKVKLLIIPKGSQLIISWLLLLIKKYFAHFKKKKYISLKLNTATATTSATASAIATVIATIKEKKKEKNEIHFSVSYSVDSVTTVVTP